LFWFVTTNQNKPPALSRFAAKGFSTLWDEFKKLKRGGKTDGKGGGQGKKKVKSKK